MDRDPSLLIDVRLTGLIDDESGEDIFEVTIVGPDDRSLLALIGRPAAWRPAT